MRENLSFYVFYYFIFSSMIRGLVVLLSIHQHPQSLGEKRVRHVVNGGAILDLLHIVIAIVAFHGFQSYTHIDNFLLSGVNLILGWDDFSLIFFSFCIIIIGLIGRFAIYYLHHDAHYFKFFSLYYVLQMSLVLLVLTRSSESIFIGWELLGVSSVLLIAFYEHNKNSLFNSLRVLVIYKLADILFYSALIYAATLGHTDYSNLTSAGVIFSITIACLIKSSIGPFLWLPKAMEGPTPSSAVFYGGLATHAPIFICINLSTNGSISHLSTQQFIILYALTGLSIFICTLKSRQCSNVKNAIAYSSIVQVGIIYVEIFLGYFALALVHCVIHATVRVFEFLRAPSILYARHAIEQNRKSLKPFFPIIQLPDTLNVFLYRQSFKEWYIPKLSMAFVDNFSGINEKQINSRNLMKFFSCGLFVLVILEVSITWGMGFSIWYVDYLFIFLAFLSSILALYNKYIPPLFFSSLLLSLAIIIDLLLEKLIPELEYFNIIYLILMCYILFKGYKIHHARLEPLKFHAQLPTSDQFNFIILVLGFSLVGIPGLMTFFVWEHLQHSVLNLAPGDIINGFALLSFNTIVFFRYFYSNYLGSEKKLAKVDATLRV